MAATRRIKSEPAQTRTVNNVVTVKADVDKLLPLKYFEISYQGPGPPFLIRYTAYKLRALIVWRGASAKTSRFQPSNKLNVGQKTHKEIEWVTFEDEEDKEREVVASFGGVTDVIKETKMIVGT